MRGVFNLVNKRKAPLYLLATLFMLLVTVSSAMAYSLGPKWQFNNVLYVYGASMPDAYKPSVYNSAGTWNAAATFKIYRDAAATHYWGASNWGSASGAVGITSLNSYNGIITYCNSDFNTYYPFATNGDSNSFDVETIALHEFGHWLSLNHSTSSSAVMYAYTSRGYIKRSLTQDDINGDKALYS